eukprot:TRINITY_DN17021_c0_g1_i1.p1 TRINITY_DN17021_c0_g1~~TRINITY_DN17021_c0_g1_i1.p1  ORF type:complete len:363 (-),score=37.11 TRINITY_DN17021_c0_g1_i1:29-1117(-)
MASSEPEETFDSLPSDFGDVDGGLKEYDPNSDEDISDIDVSFQEASDVPPADLDENPGKAPSLTTVLQCGGPVSAIAFVSPDVVLCTTEAKQVQLWSLNLPSAPILITSIRLPHKPHCFCLDSTHSQVFIGLSNGVILPFKLNLVKKTLLEGQPIHGHSNRVSSILYDDECNLVISCSYDRTLAVNCPSKNIMSSIKVNKAYATSLAMDPIGRRVFVGTFDGAITIFHVSTTGQISKRAEMKGHKGSVRCLYWDGFGTLYSGSFDRTIKGWGIAQQLQEQESMVVKEFIGHKGKVKALAGHSLPHLASSGTDWRVIVWNSHERPEYTLTGHTSVVRALVWSHDGRMLASGGNDKTIRIWGWQ